MKVFQLSSFLAFGLTACAQPAPAPQVITKIQVERVTLPAGLLTCAPEPDAGPPWTTQAQVADYLVRLEEAGADCRDTVNAIAGIEKVSPAGGP